MVAAPPHIGADAGAEPDGAPTPAHDPLACDPLDMLVTSEPVAELDAALSSMGRQLRQARRRHDGDASTRLQHWIDGRLDERATFHTDPSASCAARDVR
jgi:hypothetical protein